MSAQMNGSYFLVRSECTIDCVPYIGYGIGYRNKDEQIIFEDISTILQEVTALVNRCNIHKLSPIHIEDAVDDFLTDIYFDKPKAANAAFLIPFLSCCNNF